MVPRERSERTTARPLVVTEDPALLEDLLRLAAAAEVEVDVASSLATAGPRWDSCSLLVIGADVTSRLDARPRRTGVVLVCTREPGIELWQVAVDLGAEHVVVLPDGEQWLVEQFGDSATSTRSPAAVVAVMGGRGGAGASVRIYATSSDGSDLVLLCLDTTDGKVIWKQKVGTGNKDARSGEGNSASPSPSTDGKHLWVFFSTGVLACYTTDGKEVWNFDVGDRFGKLDIQFGMTSTPVLDGDSLYLQLIHGRMNRENQTRTGKVVKLEKLTGKTVWEVVSTRSVAKGSP